MLLLLERWEKRCGARIYAAEQKQDSPIQSPSSLLGTMTTALLLKLSYMQGNEHQLFFALFYFGMCPLLVFFWSHVQRGPFTWLHEDISSPFLS